MGRINSAYTTLCVKGLTLTLCVVKVSVGGNKKCYFGTAVK